MHRQHLGMHSPALSLIKIVMLKMQSLTINIQTLANSNSDMPASSSSKRSWKTLHIKGPRGTIESSHQDMLKPGTQLEQRDTTRLESAFTYLPLAPMHTKIRLLRLLPSKDGLICCAVQNVSMSNGQEYHALSYAWGPEQSVFEIRCNGQICTVRENLFRFLEQMHKEERFNLYFWIDQLCINQKDNVEKAQQVSSMAEIYENACKIIAWLGEEDVSAFPGVQMTWHI